MNFTLLHVLERHTRNLCSAAILKLCNASSQLYVEGENKTPSKYFLTLLDTLMFMVDETLTIKSKI